MRAPSHGYPASEEHAWTCVLLCELQAWAVLEAEDGATEEARRLFQLGADVDPSHTYIWQVSHLKCRTVSPIIAFYQSIVSWHSHYCTSELGFLCVYLPHLCE